MYNIASLRSPPSECAGRLSLQVPSLRLPAPPPPGRLALFPLGAWFALALWAESRSSEEMRSGLYFPFLSGCDVIVGVFVVS